MRKIIICIIALILINSIFSAQTVDNSYKGKQAKYVFLFIGDGMALPQISATEVYYGSTTLKEKGIVKLNFTQFPSKGITTTYDAGTFITDSASAGTALATGNKTLSGVVGMDVTKTKNFTSIAEIAKTKGLQVGIITSVSLDHATPASFYAHQPARSSYYDISVQLSKSGFDYFGGGSFLQPTGAKKDQKNTFDIAKENGYTVVSTVEDFNKLKAGGKVIAVNPVLEDESSINYEIDRDAAKGELSLADFTKKGIELLDNPKGFFMMVEGGKIDWACHANDATSTINDVISLTKAIDEAVLFQKKHPQETLIIVTGDHETGGLTIGFAGTQYETFFDKLQNQKVSFVKFDGIFKNIKRDNPSLKFEDMLPIIESLFGLSTSGENPGMTLTNYETGLLKDAFAMSMTDPAKRPVKDDTYYMSYGTYEPLTVTITHILNRKAGIGWTTYSHTGVPVATFANGIGQELFNGYYDNTDIFYKMKNIMKL
jgi:alkaline phosphatase